MLQGECTTSAVVNQTHKAHVFAVVNLDTWHLHAGVKIWTVITAEKRPCSMQELKEHRQKLKD